MTIQYDIVFASHKGRHLFIRSGKEEDYGVYRIDTLGCSLVTNFKSITREIDGWETEERLSKNNKMIGNSFRGDGGRPSRINIKYLYLNGTHTTNLNTCSGYDGANTKTNSLVGTISEIMNKYDDNTSCTTLLDV